MNIHNPSPDPIPEPHRPSFLARIRSDFLTGVIFIAPIAITGWFIWWVINFIDNKVEPFIPDRFNPNAIYGFDVPGIGVIFFIFVATIIGALTKGLLGRQTARFVSSIMNQFPIIRPIYNGLKQILEAVFSRSDQNFQSACIVEYPRKGVYAIGFIAVEARGEIREKSKKDLLAVFVPTTPNPTSGFLLYFPPSDVKVLDMNVEDAAKLVISAGIAEPETSLITKPK